MSLCKICASLFDGGAFVCLVCATKFFGHDFSQERIDQVRAALRLRDGEYLKQDNTAEAAKPLGRA